MKPSLMHRISFLAIHTASKGTTLLRNQADPNRYVGWIWRRNGGPQRMSNSAVICVASLTRHGSFEIKTG